MGVWHVVVMMDMEISCKGHCEKSSHFLYHVSHTVDTIYIVSGEAEFCHVTGMIKSL